MLNLRTHSLVLATVPTLIVAVLLTGYFTYTRLHELEAELLLRGQVFARQLAPTSEYGIFSGNLGALEDVSRAAINEAGARSAAVYDADGSLLTRSGPVPRAYPIGSRFGRTLTAAESDDGLSLVLVAPVFESLTPIDDFDETYPGGAEPGVDSRPLGWVEVELSREAMLAEKARVLHDSLWILAVVLLLSAAIGIRSSYGITRPLMALKQAVEKLQKGQLDTRVHLGSQGELQQLSQGFNTMAEAFQASQEALRDQIELSMQELQETLETMELQNAELAITRKEALTASKAKSEFLASMSHEVRTPLNGVIGYSNLLLKTAMTEEQLEYALTIRRSAQALLHIVNDILDFSKVEADKLELEFEDFPLAECIEDVLDLLAPTADEKRIDLIYHIDPDVPPVIRADPVRVRQILVNLVSNAVKFTQGGEVTVQVSLHQPRTEQDVLVFEVADTGMGLSPDEQRRLFQAFKQAETGASRRYGGTGLGLVISKKLVEKMHGSISLDSRPGAGTRVTFSIRTENGGERRDTPRIPGELAGKRCLIRDRHPLALRTLMETVEYRGLHPIACAHDNDPGIDIRGLDEGPDVILISLNHNENQAHLKRMLLDLRAVYNGPVIALVHGGNPISTARLTELGITSGLRKPLRAGRLLKELRAVFADTGGDGDAHATSSGGGIASTRLQGLRILAAEDHEINLRLVKTLLTAAGANVEIATDGAQALELASTEHFDVILMDVHMPAMDGLEVTGRLRSREKDGAHTPIVALTADAIEGNRERFLTAGMDDYLTKPIDEESLYAVIENWTDRGRPRSGGAPAAADGPLPIWDEAAALKVTGGRAQLARELLALLADDVPLRQGLIREAQRTGDLEQAAEIAHTLAGGAGHCGARALERAARDMQSACLAGIDADIGPAAERLDAEAVRLLDLIRQIG